MSNASQPRRRYLVGGVVVIAVAIWILLQAAGVGVPSLEQFWPVFVLLGGLASALDFFAGSRAPGSLGKGVAGIGVAALAFGFTTDRLNWRNFFDWFPAIPLIAGLAFLTTWAADRYQTSSYLILGIVGLGLGVTGYAHHLDWLAKFLPTPAVSWAILLLILGIFLLWKNFRGGGGTASSAE
ncbi:MAG: hypothetical protein K0U98_18420 [Deltaproteobacteria bacterium]|nr:hypothetical protein [Deltaproteobacteria bacterium]